MTVDTGAIQDVERQYAMTDTQKFQPPQAFQESAHVQSLDTYREMYQRSIDDPDGFWADVAEGFHWKDRWTKVRDFDFTGDISIKYFVGATTNITYNALDRHLATRGDQTAIIWEGNEPGEDARLTYRELHAEVCKFANVLKSFGVGKGDRVSIYMPMVTELAIADPGNPGPAALRDTGRLCYPSGDRAVASLGHLYRYARHRERRST